MSDTDRLARINALEGDALRAALAQCCGATRWVEAMAARHPYSSTGEIHRLAERIWSEMSRDDILEAISHHPRIGADLDALRARGGGADEWSAGEQAGVSDASSDEQRALREATLRYEDRFGHTFIVCATGKSAREMRELCEHRMVNGPDRELRVCAAEIAKITALRLEKL